MKILTLPTKKKKFLTLKQSHCEIITEITENFGDLHILHSPQKRRRKENKSGAHVVGNFLSLPLFDSSSFFSRPLVNRSDLFGYRWFAGNPNCIESQKVSYPFFSLHFHWQQIIERKDRNFPFPFSHYIILSSSTSRVYRWRKRGA